MDAGVIGFKVHEDWGATPAVIDRRLKVCEEHGVQLALHADSLNESGFVEDTSRPSTSAPSTSSTSRAPAAATRPT